MIVSESDPEQFAKLEFSGEAVAELREYERKGRAMGHVALRKIGRWGWVGFLLGCVAVTLQSPQVWGQEQQRPIGYAIAVEGGVSVVAKGEAPRAATLRQEIFIRDVIKTGPESATKILFTDNTVLSISPDSELEVTTFAYDAAAFKRTTIFTLKQGRVKAEVPDFYTDTASRFEIHTEAGVFAARGTVFVVWTFTQNGARSAGGAVISGNVTVTNVGGQSVTIPAGQFSTTSRVSPPSQPSPTAANSQVQQVVQQATVKTAPSVTSQVTLQMARQETAARQAVTTAEAVAATAVEAGAAQTGSQGGAGGVSPALGTTNTPCVIVSTSGNEPAGCTPTDS